MQHIIALMPMKGESVRVPDKNMRSFNGRPLCSVMLEKLTKSKYVSRVIVNTDSQRIMAFIQANFPGVEVVKRPTDLCGHDVSMNRIIRHDMDKFPADYYLQTHSTNPLLKEETIDEAIRTMLENKDSHDSLFSVTAYQTRFFNEDGTAVNHDPRVLLKTQDLPKLYEENSCLYLFTKKSFDFANSRIGRRPLMFNMPFAEAVDIDIEEEFIFAETLANFL